MNDRQDFSDIGERIQRAIRDAAETKDFGEINHIVTDTVNGAMEEVRWQVNHVRGRMQSNSYRNTYQQAKSQTQSAGSSSYRQAQQTSVQREPEIRINRSGRVGAILMIIFGSIAMGAFGVAAIANLILWAFVQNLGALIPAVVLGVLGLTGAGVLAKGCKSQARLKRAERYAQLGRENRYVELADLSQRTGKSLKKLRADVRKMLKQGIYPEGHLDKEEKYLLFSDESWEQFSAAQKSLEERQRQQKAEEKNSELQIEKEGRAYMDRLRQLNVEIPGEVISNKLYELDCILQRIFQVLREHPEKAPQMEKFMEYYLPATVGLVESYADFDRAGVQGESVLSAKEEIEKTMDTINQAFEKLLNDMFQSAAFEAEADAQVLKTMLAQDGYMKSDFE